MSIEVIILAAGIGSRLKPYTKKDPKPLVKVNDIPILHNTIENLITRDINNITIVLGYNHQVITNYLEEHFKHVKFKYIINEKYAVTNNMYSLYLALKKNECSAPLLIIEGDVFFEGSILDYLESINVSGNYWFVDSLFRESNGSYIRSSDGEISGISIVDDMEKIMNDENYSKSTGMVYISSIDSRNFYLWLEAYVENGEVNMYYDNVLANYVEELKMRIIDIKDKKWYEIDNREDLEKAEMIFK